MLIRGTHQRHTAGATRKSRGAWAALGLCLALLGLGGCSAFHPIRGVPVNYYPQDMRGPVRSGKKTIDLSLLRQTPPDHYLIEAGDVLGVYIEGILGSREQVPPVYFPTNSDIPPSLGYPIPVRDDGTISLPLTKPIVVRGLTMSQVEDAVRRAYTVDQKILQEGQDRILVSLQKPRHYNVMVIRQEATVAPQMSGGMGGQVNLGDNKRGTGKLINLPAYKNDVLHALAETGGLPGLDAENTIYVIRRKTPPVLPPERPAPPGARPAVTPTAGRGRGNIVPMSGTRSASARGSIQTAGGFSTDDASSGNDTPWGYTNEAVTQTPPPAPNGPSPMGPALSGQQPLEFAPGGASGIGLPPGVNPRPGDRPITPMGPGYGPGIVPGYGRDLPAYQDGPMPQDFPQGGYPNFAELQQYGINPHASQIIRIPVRLTPGERPQFTEQDIILQDGDIVFIESRETEIFYTGGLLGGGQYTLPRDYDLDVLGAISIASGRVQGGGAAGGNHVGGISALNQDISVGASDVVVLRQMADGCQVPIRIDLRKALRDPKYRIRIQPGDYIVLQYRPLEAMGAFVERNLLAGGIIGLLALGGGTGGGGGN